MSSNDFSTMDAPSRIVSAHYDVHDKRQVVVLHFLCRYLFYTVLCPPSMGVWYVAVWHKTQRNRTIRRGRRRWKLIAYYLQATGPETWEFQQLYDVPLLSTIYHFVFFTFSFLISCNSSTSDDTFCECRSTPGLISTSQLNIGFGLPPSLTQANVNSEFSLTGTNILPASKRLESINKYGGFGGSAEMASFC